MSGDKPYALDRLSETTLPGVDSGTVIYAGQYAGQYQTSGPQYGHIFGDATLTVNFADLEIFGTVTNRANTGGLAADDIALQVTALDNGAFTGTSTGGALSGAISQGGTYMGLLTGPDGNEAIAHVTIRSTLEGVFYNESGAIIAIGQ